MKVKFLLAVLVFGIILIGRRTDIQDLGQREFASKTAKRGPHLLIINGSKSDDVLNRGLQRFDEIFKEARSFEKVTELATDSFEIKNSFSRGHDIKYFSSLEFFAPANVLGPYLRADQPLLLWWVGHSPEYLGRTRGPQINKLEGEVPWPGLKSPLISEISNSLRQIRVLASQPKPLFYFAPTCFSERTHRLAFENENTCGIGNARWNQLAKGSQQIGNLTANLFFDAINDPKSDLNYDGQLSLFEIFVYISRFDFLNFPNVSLSSQSYFKNFAAEPFVSSETYEWWNNDDSTIIWNHLSRELVGLAISPAKICNSLNVQSKSSSRIFSTEDLEVLPASFRSQFVAFLASVCAENQSYLLTHESLYSVERLMSELRELQRLENQCVHAGFLKGSGMENSSAQRWARPTFVQSKIRNFTKAYEINEENCRQVPGLFFERQMEAIELTRSDRWGLSPLPLILAVKRMTDFLRRGAASTQKKKLQQLLDCESYPVFTEY